MWQKIRSWLVGGLLVGLLGCWGCSASKEIKDLTPPANQLSLQQLESHLDYVDPDAGQPNYRRDD